MEKHYSYKHGDVFLERLFPSGMYLVYLRDSAGEMVDKVRCDSYRTALEYKRAFALIAKHNKR